MSGFDISKFDPQPSQELICSICYCVLSNPLESHCRHVFCKQCIETWLQRHHTCPTCRNYLRRHHLKPVLPLVQNMLNALTMVCDFRDSGCQTPVMMEQYDNHIKSCEYQTVTCSIGCEQQLLLKDKLGHEQSMCEWRIVRCQQGCELSLPFRETTSHSCVMALKECVRGKEKQLEDVMTLLQKIAQVIHGLSCILDDVSSLRSSSDRLYGVWNQVKQVLTSVDQVFQNTDVSHLAHSAFSSSHVTNTGSSTSTSTVSMSSSLSSSCTAVERNRNNTSLVINLDEEIAYGLEQPATSLLQSLVEEPFVNVAREERQGRHQSDGNREGGQNEDGPQNQSSVNRPLTRYYRRYQDSADRSDQEVSELSQQETSGRIQEAIEGSDQRLPDNSSSEDEDYLPRYRTPVPVLSPLAEGTGSDSRSSYSHVSGSLSGSFDSSDHYEYTPINSTLGTDDISESFTMTSPSLSFDSASSEISNDTISEISQSEEHSEASRHSDSENALSLRSPLASPRTEQAPVGSGSHPEVDSSPHADIGPSSMDGEHVHPDNTEQVDEACRVRNSEPVDQDSSHQVSSHNDLQGDGSCQVRSEHNIADGSHPSRPEESSSNIRHSNKVSVTVARAANSSWNIAHLATCSQNGSDANSLSSGSRHISLALQEVPVRAKLDQSSLMNSSASSSLRHTDRGQTNVTSARPTCFRDLWREQCEQLVSDRDSEELGLAQERQTEKKCKSSGWQRTSKISSSSQDESVVHSASTFLEYKDEHDGNQDTPDVPAQMQSLKNIAEHIAGTSGLATSSSLLSDENRVAAQREKNSGCSSFARMDPGVQNKETGGDSARRDLGREIPGSATADHSDTPDTNISSGPGSTGLRLRFRLVYTSSVTESDDTREPKTTKSTSGCMPAHDTEQGHSEAQAQRHGRSDAAAVTQPAESSLNSCQGKACMKRKGTCVHPETEAKQAKVQKQVPSSSRNIESYGSLAGGNETHVADARSAHYKVTHHISPQANAYTLSACTASGSSMPSVTRNAAATTPGSSSDLATCERQTQGSGISAINSIVNSANLSPVCVSMASRTRSSQHEVSLSQQTLATQQPRRSRRTRSSTEGRVTASDNRLVHIPDIPVPPNTYQLLTAYAEDDETDSTWSPSDSSQSESE